MNDKKRETDTRDIYITYSSEVIEQARKYAVAMSEARIKK
jgi:post-segregation antitoxin (ccd killing protein)